MTLESIFDRKEELMIDTDCDANIGDLMIMLDGRKAVVLEKPCDGKMRVIFAEAEDRAEPKEEHNERNVLVVIGNPPSRTVYLNLTEGHALARYCNENHCDPEAVMRAGIITTFDFLDSFVCIDASPHVELCPKCKGSQRIRIAGSKSQTAICNECEGTGTVKAN